VDVWTLMPSAKPDAIKPRNDVNGPARSIKRLKVCHLTRHISQSSAMASATAADLQTPSHPVPAAANTSVATQFPPINIGTRRSALAQIQARSVELALKKAHPDRTYNICPVLAQGDKDKITPLQQLSQGENAKSLWTGELEAMLESGELDLVVHCLKGTHIRRVFLSS
jgi:hypothetical protein